MADFVPSESQNIDTFDQQLTPGQLLAGYDSLAGLKIKDEHLRQVLLGNEFLVQDGAMGTMLQNAGLATPGVVPDLLNFSHPEEITAIHKQYVDAGAQMVITNTFGANRYKLEGQASVAEVYQAAADNVRASGARYIAGDIGPIGTLLEPMGSLSFEEAYDIFKEQVEAAVSAGCDLLVFETLSDLTEAKAGLLAAKENSNLPVLVTMTFEQDGRTFLGTPPEVAAATLSSMGAQAIGINCSLGPKEMYDFAKTLVEFSRVPVIVRPNAGLPRIEGDATVYDITPQEFAEAFNSVLDLGVSIVGGCCGTNPDFIRQISALTAQRKKPAKRPFKEGLVLTSGQEAVFFPQGSPKIAVIGERINPTGKPKLKAALRENNLDYIVGEAVGQRDFGADVLDVNVGLPELDEPAVLEAAVKKLQATVTLPLVIDSSDPVAIERAVRSYAGKPLINSVNGKQENMDAVLPLVAKYGCSVIGLALDEGGIPPTAEERFAIAEKIVKEAAKYGIPPYDIVIDCLTMAVATNQKEAMAIIDGIKMVKQRLGVRTALGVSNISFGLPQRNVMSSNFLAAAFGAGLDLPIINPSAARYRDVVRCYKVINGQDVRAEDYISYCQENPDPYEHTGVSVDQEKMAAGLALIAQAVGETNISAVASLAQLASRGTNGTGDALRNSVGNAGGAQGVSALPASTNEVLPFDIPEGLKSVQGQAEEIYSLILSGRKDSVGEKTAQLIGACDPLEIIDGLFIPTLDEVGQRFDKGTFFLPQLMASAEAVKAGFDEIKKTMGEGAQGDNQKKIALATVKGDIHDIGKNIVKMLLENYGFVVVDLGKDVSPEEILRVVKERDIKLVGLSALMTTTVKAMEQTIELLHEQAPEVKTFVGGAVLTPDYAQTMGADWYAKDAAESARIAEAFFEK